MVTLSLSLPSFAAEDPGDWSPLLDLARAADDAGVDRVVVSDHVVFGERLDEYGRPEVGGQAGGTQPTGPDGHWLDPLIVLAAVASGTRRVRLGTGVLLAALRRPAVLAKQLATLDVLSNGRVDLGVGVGWQREEYEAVGLAFERRGRLLDHTLEVCRTLWTEARADYDAPELRFRGIHQMPKPRQVGGVPIWVSGTGNRAVHRRLARFGSTWILWGDAMSHPEPAIAGMRAALAELDHPDPGAVGVSAPLGLIRSQDGGLDERKATDLVAGGVTDFRGGLPARGDQEAMAEALGSFVDRFRRAVG
jgi:probable F420-dependent oxidoreductase